MIGHCIKKPETTCTRMHTHAQIHIYTPVCYGDACGEVVIVVGTGDGERSSNPDEAVCISLIPLGNIAMDK